MRALVIAVVVAVVAGAGSAEAGRGGGGIVVVNTGDDIEHVRDLSSDLAAQLGYGKLGYRYERFGLFWMDLWRWDGEFVAYEGSTYVSLGDDELALLGGGSVPWRYHLPDGLLIVVAALYLAFIGRRKRSAKATLYIAGALLAISIVFFVMGLTWEFGIPLVIALHHGLAARSAMRGEADDEAEPAAPVDEPAPPVRTSQSPFANIPRPSQPRPVVQPFVDSGPLPSRPSQPLVVERATTTPIVVPMRADDSVDGPKLLR